MFKHLYVAVGNNTPKEPKVLSELSPLIRACSCSRALLLTLRARFARPLCGRTKNKLKLRIKEETKEKILEKTLV